MGRSRSWLLGLLVACAAPGGSPAAPAPHTVAAEASEPPPVEPVAHVIAPAEAPAALASTPPEPLALELPAIDALVSRAVAQGKLPGAVVAIGRRDGVVWQRAYGSRALVPAREPMTLDTVFDLASLTKSVATATAALWLVEQGKLKLDAAVGPLLPEVAPAARAITVRQLLLHTSGLPAVVPLTDPASGPRLALERVLKATPQHPPGARYQYSDVGFIWLGVALERAAGEPLDALVRRAVLEPLAMTDSGYIASSGQAPDAAWVARVAPTERTDARPVPLIRGEVHDPRAYRLGGVAGNAGLFSTARDLSRFARMLLGRGALLEPGGRAVVLREATVAELTEPRRAGAHQRTLGWDAASPHSRNRGALLSARAFGHGGYTGTALWIDPEQDLFVLFLSNRVHPNGDGDVLDLTAQVNDAAVRGVARAAPCPAPGEPVKPGIDVLRGERFARIAGRRVGLLTHRAARAADGAETLEIFARASELTLAAVFTPEHGLDARAEGLIASGAHAGAGHAQPVPVHSLFGKRATGRRPTPAMLRGLDVIAIDLVDVGARFYTYASTVRETLIAASEAKLPVLVLDRPNPLGADRVEGPMLDADIRSFVNHHALPIRHGMTLGELARLMALELGLDVQLEVVRAAGYHRAMAWPQAGLAWHAPSPSLTSHASALFYPSVGVLEGTNVSVGRGTDAPFQRLGAPYLDGERLAAAVSRDAPPGVIARAAVFTPASGPFAGEPCRGLELTLTDPRAYSTARTAFALIRGLLAQPGWDHRELIRLLGHKRAWGALRRGVATERILGDLNPELEAFAARREAALLYPTCTALTMDRR